jgi:hypothetical protein
MMKMSRIMAFLMAVLMVLPSATAVVYAADGSVDEDDYEIILEDECLRGVGDCRQLCVSVAPEPETKPVTTVKSESKPTTKKPAVTTAKTEEEAVTTSIPLETKPPVTTNIPAENKPDESLEEDSSEDSFSDMFSDILSMFGDIDFGNIDFDLGGFSGEDISSGIHLTPDGNMSLVDDIYQDESFDEGEQRVIQSKQFITVQTKSGNSFYIIIDRSKDGENVYFLNLVDESDLLALMEDEPATETPAEPEKPAECICKDKDRCELGAVNAECEVCKMDLTKCIGKEKPKEEAKPDEAEKEAPKKEKKSVNPALLLLPLLALAGGGAYWFFKIRKPKPKNVRNLDDYNFEDSAGYGEETDIDETESSEDNDNDLEEDI